MTDAAWTLTLTIGAISALGIIGWLVKEGVWR